MKVVVKLFAGARELVGKDEIEVELSPGATIGQLRAEIVRQYAKSQPLVAHAMFALDATYCSDQAVIPENVVVACIPPVSGG